MARPVLNEFYANLLSEVKSVVDGEPDFIANASNIGMLQSFSRIAARLQRLANPCHSAAALVFHGLNVIKNNRINWAGFYFEKHGQLVLGPFQGTCPPLPEGFFWHSYSVLTKLKRET